MAIRIALVGNPNCGKTTMFNALTGANQYVGNWPGVTVEKKEGKLKDSKSGEEIIITDLPGIYSLSPYTLEEVVSRDYLLKEKPDAIINLVDATNIERNLYLTTQVLEVGIPVVIALNMSDLLKKTGDRIDAKKLGAALGCEMVETSALKRTGLKEVVEKAVKLAKTSHEQAPEKRFAEDVEAAIGEVENCLPAGVPEVQRRWYAVKLLERDSKVEAQLTLDAGTKSKVESVAKQLEKAHDDDMESIITNERYEYITKLIRNTVKKSGRKMSTSDRIDQIVTNRILGLPIFALVMWLVYYVSVSTVGTMGTDWANDSFVVGIQDMVSAALASAGAGELVTGLIVDGIIGGLGAVFGFLPQMAILFIFLSILEDCGYMVRIAFVMDRVFRHFGLSGKSFIPLLISSGCGIPGIMASRTIENDNDRRLTIMTATFVPCGAKLPVIALMGGLITGWATGNYGDAGSWAFIMYVIGVAAVLVSAIMLKKTKPFSGEPAPFVMELPAYHIPSIRTVAIHVWERLFSFIKKAGTILFLACVVMWVLSTFGFTAEGFGMVEDSADSLMGVVGGFIAPLFHPLGWGVGEYGFAPVAASISGFSAKENIVTTIGILAGVAEEASEDAPTVAAAIRGWFPNVPAAISFLVFNMLNSPCLAAIATMAQQLQSRRWFWFAILFQNIFAYLVSMMIYQLGTVLMGGAFGVGTLVSILVLLGMLYMLFRPDPYKNAKVAARRSVAM